MCSTETDGVSIERVFGTKLAVKQRMANAINDYREAFADELVVGATDAEMVKEYAGHKYHQGGLYAWADFENHHTDVTAVLEPEQVAITQWTRIL